MTNEEKKAHIDYHIDHLEFQTLTSRLLLALAKRDIYQADFENELRCKYVPSENEMMCLMSVPPETSFPLTTIQHAAQRYHAPFIASWSDPPPFFETNDFRERLNLMRIDLPRDRRRYFKSVSNCRYGMKRKSAISLISCRHPAMILKGINKIVKCWQFYRDGISFVPNYKCEKCELFSPTPSYQKQIDK
jgi:hypothetical protein